MRLYRMEQSIKQDTMNRTVLSKLVRLNIITPGGICRLAKCFVQDGVSLMALMRFSAHYYPNRCALVSDDGRFTYRELFELAQRLTRVLHSDYGLEAGASVGMMCRSHLMATLLLPALSRLGVRIKLINIDIAPSKLIDFVKNNHIKLLICDTELKDTRIPDGLSCTVRETEDLFLAISNKDHDKDTSLPCIKRGGEISVFTGGSSGKHKEAARRMSIFQFLPPFFALLRDLHIDERDSVFLPLPLYHGFGLSTLIISLLMGKKVCLAKHFDADKALKIISEEKIDVLPVVPAMLARMWQTDNAPMLMKTVKCVICGGDRLDRKWIDLTTRHLGKIIYNLFGTTEAGFFMLATPQDLLRHEEVTIGRPICGVKCKVENIDSDGIGSLWVRSSWAMIGMKDKWQNTGDMVHCNAEGYYFYRGRSDKMIVCGGENVYPEDVEKVINGHPEVVNSIVFPTADPLFGTVLNAKVELMPHSTISPDEIRTWLNSRLSRAEMPHQIFIQPISISETGKTLRNKGDRS